MSLNKLLEGSSSIGHYGKKEAMGLNNLTFDKDDVIGVVVMNKEKHVTEFNQAYAGWIDVCRSKIDAEAARQFNGKAPDEFFSFPAAPVSHEDDYNRVIDMLEYTTDQEVVLSQSEFDQFMRDEWAWKSQHLVSMTAYTG